MSRFNEAMVVFKEKTGISTIRGYILNSFGPEEYKLFNTQETDKKRETRQCLLTVPYLPTLLKEARDSDNQGVTPDIMRQAFAALT